MPFAASKNVEWVDSWFNDRIFPKDGGGADGYQGGTPHVGRNIPGGGIGNRQMPSYHFSLYPQDIDISKWYHTCTAYSSTKHRLHQFQNGLKVYGFTYTDEKEDPLPKNAFETTALGVNMRGLITEVHVYSRFFDEKAMSSWTSTCLEEPGDIFPWDLKLLKINYQNKEEDVPMNVTLVTLDKSEVCPDPTKPSVAQKSSKSARKSGNGRFNPMVSFNYSTFIGSVLELMPDSDFKTTRDAQDRCFRLNGALMQLPQNEEEENLFDNLIWDYLRKRTNNDISEIVNTFMKMGWILVAAETRVDEKGQVLPDSRELVYPPGGEVELFHPWTKAPLKSYREEFLLPQGNSMFYSKPMCPLCNRSMKKPRKKDMWHDRLKPICILEDCEKITRRWFICVFKKAPTFTVRGLCKDAVMDTRYKFAQHPPGPLGEENGDSRSYVGPKGWIISQDKSDNRWRMTHYHYTDLTLTMLDQDTVPVGRHKWLVKNNACNEGKTSSAILQISGCKEEQFTCDDGKCIAMSQRCNNIEVRPSYSSNFFLKTIFSMLNSGL